MPDLYLWVTTPVEALWRHLRLASIVCATICSTICCSLHASGIEPEQVGRVTLHDPQPSWVVSRDALGPRYVMDVASGEMVGMLSTTEYTPAIATHAERREIYAVESYYSRATRGERTDLVTVFDFANLKAIDEIRIPNKAAALAFPQYIALLDDQAHLAVFNLTPAMSVSVVNVIDREFVGEISTPGCSLIMPTPGLGFLQICADGRLQLIRLNEDGSEQRRLRSERFFDLDVDPVFDRPVTTTNGWLLLSYTGKVFDVTVNDDEIEVEQSWQLLSDAQLAEDWRPGGAQFVQYYAPLDLLVVLMSQGGEFSHDGPGSEVWLYDKSSRRRVAAIDLPESASNVIVTGGEQPLITVAGDDGQLHVFDLHTTRLLHSIGGIGIAPGLLQSFGGR